MKTQSCPLTLAFLRKFRQKVEEYDDLQFEFQEVWDSAQSSNSARDVLLLRAFYVVEALYHVALPATSTARTPIAQLSKARNGVNIDGLAAGGKLITTLKKWRFPRSRQGMTELLVTLQQLADETEVDDYAAALNRKIDRDVRNVRADAAKNWRAVLATTTQTVRELRPALNPESDVSWQLFGTRLGEGFEQAHIDLDDCLEHAKRLLSVDPHHIVSPWQERTSSQE
jgi:hypothetical protein